MIQHEGRVLLGKGTGSGSSSSSGVQQQQTKIDLINKKKKNSKIIYKWKNIILVEQPARLLGPSALCCELVECFLVNFSFF